MEDRDKILLSAYIDGDLEENEIKYIENLLDKDIQAQSYLNDLKRVNSGVENYYLDSLKTETAKEAFKEIQKLQEDTVSISTKIRNFLSPRILFTNLATLSLAVIGLSFLNDDEIANSLEGFNTISLEKYKIEKSRSSDEELLNDDFQVVISSMLDKKVANMSVEYGAETFLISIEGVAYSDDDQTLCYKGKVFSKVNQSFVYCKKDEKSSLLITN